MHNAYEYNVIIVSSMSINGQWHIQKEGVGGSIDRDDHQHFKFMVVISHCCIR